MTKPLSDSPGSWQQSTIRRLLKWLFSWRTARRALMGLACLMTMWALFCTEENIRGQRAWDKYRRELEARGEQMDYKTFIPKPIPDEQNFAATPLIKSWFVRSNNVYLSSDYWRNDIYGLSEANIADGQPKGDSGSRRFVDLAAWGTAFDAIRAGTFTKGRKVAAGKLDRESRAEAAPLVLAALKTNEPVFAELRAASQRPFARYPINWDVEDPFSILLPHLNNVRAVCRRLRLKACAELAAGHSDEALDDVKLMLRLADSLREEPFLISYLVRVACLQIATEPVWEGLAEHRWSDAQLQELQARLQSCDFVTDVKHPYEVERAAGIVTADLVRKYGPGYLISMAGSGSPPSSEAPAAKWLGVFLPTSGWLYFEQVNVYRGYQSLLDGTIDSSQRRVFPERTEANTHDFERGLAAGKLGLFIHHRILASLLLPALNRIIVKVAVGQTIADHPASACAVERYRISRAWK